jgi:ABC-2 type transport system ATP-binding protein
MSQRTADITVEGLHKSYGSRVALRGLTFDVGHGEIFGILGPNGAGKTTLVECLQGLRRYDEGVVRVLGMDPAREADALRRRIGSQLQESALPDRIRVWEALDLFASLVPGGHDWREVMQEWGLEAKRDATFASLSGGQRQRLFVALALVNDPDLVFLDEMTTGLDPGSRRTAWRLIHGIRDRGTTVVLVTHFMDEAAELCDRIAIVDRAEIVALDTPDGLVGRHGGSVAVSFSTTLADVGWLGGLPEVTDVTRDGAAVTVRGGPTVPVRVAAALAGRGEIPGDLCVVRPTLEDVFLTLTRGG